MSKTPRTDEHLRMKEENGHTVKVSSEFARQLERELAEARAEIERKDKLIEQMREALEKISACRRRACYRNQLLHDEVNILALAALAAERGE